MATRCLPLSLRIQSPALHFFRNVSSSSTRHSPIKKKKKAKVEEKAEPKDEFDIAETQFEPLQVKAKFGASPIFAAFQAKYPTQRLVSQSPITTPLAVPAEATGKVKESPPDPGSKQVGLAALLRLTPSIHLKAS